MSSEKKCLGCGVLLQDENILQEGYTTSIENDICQRCFRMKNYGEYQVVTKSNEEYINILKGVAETKDLVLYITDLINLERNLEEVRNNKSSNYLITIDPTKPAKGVTEITIDVENTVYNKRSIFYADGIVVNEIQNLNGYYSPDEYDLTSELPVNYEEYSDNYIYNFQHTYQLSYQTNSQYAV